MPFIELRLIDPAPDKLLASLKKATKTANGRLRDRLLDKDEAAWQRFLSRNRKKAEGHQSYRGHRTLYNSPLVEVAWWTDAIGRKHWRIVGKRTEWEVWGQDRSPFRAQALWWVYPDRVMLRERQADPGKTEALGVCTCGAAGPLARLGWMGPHCGPCHDRLEEGTAVDPRVDPLLRLERHTAQVVFTADGERLLSGGHDGRIILWDLGERTHRVLLHRSGGHVYSLAVSPTGTIAASTANNRLLLSHLDDPTQWQTVQHRLGHIETLSFSPDGKQLAIHGSTSRGLLDPDDPTAPIRPVLADRYCRLLGFVGDGKSLILFDFEHGLSRLALPAGEPVTLRPPGHDFDLDDDDVYLDEYFFEDLYYDGGMNNNLASSADGQWLAVVGSWDGWSGPHLCHLPSNRWWPLQHEGAAGGSTVQALRFTADGKLAVAEGHGALRLWDIASREMLGVLYPMPEWGHGTKAFAPDGARVAVGDAKNIIHVFPWREILQSK